MRFVLSACCPRPPTAEINIHKLDLILHTDCIYGLTLNPVWDDVLTLFMEIIQFTDDCAINTARDLDLLKISQLISTASPPGFSHGVTLDVPM